MAPRGTTPSARLFLNFQLWYFTIVSLYKADALCSVNIPLLKIFFKIEYVNNFIMKEAKGQQGDH